MPLVLDRHGFNHRAAQLGGQFDAVDHQAAFFCHIGHIERNHHRQVSPQQLQHQPQVHAQVGRIDHGDDGVNLALPRASAFQHVEGDRFIGRVRAQTVNARQIDHGKLPPIAQPRHTGFALDGDARVVGDFLTRPGQQVEQRSFAAVGVAHQGQRQFGKVGGWRRHSGGRCTAHAAAT